MNDRRTLTGEPGFEVRVRDDAGTTVVEASGELDIATVPELDAAVHEHLARGPVRLDLTELTYMDSSGVRMLDSILRAVREHGRRFSIAPSLQDPVRQVLELTGMMGVLPLEP